MVNVQIKSLLKSILIATLNGIIGEFIVEIIKLIYRDFITYFGYFGPPPLVFGGFIFVVSLVALNWEKYNIVNVKSKQLVSLSPVVKGVMISEKYEKILGQCQ